MARKAVFHIISGRTLFIPFLTGRVEIWGVLLGLAKEYGLALRVAGQSMIDLLQSQGWPTNDYDFLDSFLLDPVTKAARYAQLLHELPIGLSEWAVRPGLHNAELLAIEPDGNYVRQTDLDFWTSSQAKEIVKEEGIILLDYRSLQVVWRVLASFDEPMILMRQPHTP